MVPPPPTPPRKPPPTRARPSFTSPIRICTTRSLRAPRLEAGQAGQADPDPHLPSLGALYGSKDPGRRISARRTWMGTKEMIPRIGPRERAGGLACRSIRRMKSRKE